LMGIPDGIRVAFGLFGTMPCFTVPLSSFAHSGSS